MRRAGRMNDEGLGIADIGEVGNQLQRIDEFAPGRPAARLGSGEVVAELS